MHNTESIKKTIQGLIERGKIYLYKGHTFLFINLFAVSNLSEKQIGVEATTIVWIFFSCEYTIYSLHFDSGSISSHNKYRFSFKDSNL